MSIKEFKLPGFFETPEESEKTTYPIDPNLLLTPDQLRRNIEKKERFANEVAYVQMDEEIKRNLMTLVDDHWEFEPSEFLRLKLSHNKVFEYVRKAYIEAGWKDLMINSNKYRTSINFYEK